MPDFADSMLRISHYREILPTSIISTHVSHIDFDFQTTSAEEHALFNMPRMQQTILLDLRASNILISVLPTIDQLISKTFHLEGNQRILKRGTQKILFNRREIEVVNAP